MSCSMALRRSPKPGVFTAATFKPPRSLLTTRVASASDFIPADVVENRTDFGIFERAPQRGINYAAYPATCSAMRAQRNLGFHLSAARRSEALDFRAATKRNLATKPSTWPVIFANRLILDRLDGDRAQKFLKDFTAGLKREGLAGESCATRSPRCFTLDSS